jgi:hypothetical protein
MKSTQTQNWPDAPSSESTWSDAGKLSRKVRELAHRSHRVLRAGKRPDGVAQVSETEFARDVRDLRNQVARLQRKIHDRRLYALISWVDALRRQVEAGLPTREMQLRGEIENLSERDVANL